MYAFTMSSKFNTLCAFVLTIIFILLVFMTAQTEIISPHMCAFFPVLLSYSNDCPEKCEILYDPVCGSNGRTYKNNCHLARENCFGTKEEVTEVHKGECLKNEEDEAEDQK